jgi:hypothetical protein
MRQGPAMSAALAYENLVEDFNRRLLTQLRGHAAEADYLEMWVPDEDPVKSIVNMVEAAAAYGRAELSVSVAATTLPRERHAALAAALGALGRVEIRPAGARSEIVVTGIGG